jgi:hypothetical protein
MLMEVVKWVSTLRHPGGWEYATHISHIPYLRVYKPHFFDKNLPSKIGVRLIHGMLFLLTTEPATPVLYVVELPVETASFWDLQAIAHARMHQRIIDVSAHFDYIRVADTVDSQKSEARGITDKLP